MQRDKKKYGKMITKKYATRNWSDAHMKEKDEKIT